MREAKQSKRWRADAHWQARPGVRTIPDMDIPSARSCRKQYVTVPNAPMRTNVDMVAVRLGAWALPALLSAAPAPPASGCTADGAALTLTDAPFGWKSAMKDDLRSMGSCGLS